MSGHMRFDAFNGASILVVGGAGFVGSNLCEALLGYDPRSLIIVDNLLSADITNVPEHQAVDFVFGSITHGRILEALPRDLDYVFHLACYHGNQSSICDPIADHDNNTLTSLLLFDRVKDFKKLQKVVYSAAGCAVAEKTYDEASATREDAPVSLFHDSPYSVSKLIGELYGNYYFQRYNMPFVKARFQNVYGPGEILGAGQWRGTPATVWRNVIPTFIYKALKGKALPVENRGIATRDFIYVEDIVEGLMLLATEGEAGGVYNLASGAQTAVLELAELVNELTENETPIEFKPAREWDRSGKRFADTTRSRERLGFEARVPLREGLAHTVDWARENMETIERCIRQHRRYFKGQSVIGAGNRNGS